MAARTFASDGNDFRAAAHQVRDQVGARMVERQRALHFLRYRPTGREAREAHRGRAGRLLRAVPVCVARAVRNMADAPAAQPFIRATAAWFESQAVGGAPGARIAPAGESGTGVSSGRAHVTQYKEQEG